jgi:hypothetical protein
MGLQQIKKQTQDKTEQKKVCVGTNIPWLVAPFSS